MTEAKHETGKAATGREMNVNVKPAAGPQLLPLLLEVGCEEIPARFLHDAERSLGERLQAALAEARLLPRLEAPRALAHERVDLPGEPLLETYSTPRRLIVYVPFMLARQPDRIEEVLGPPVKVAVDAAGKYTRAAESFAQKNSVPLEDLVRTTTPKGEYLSLRKTTRGQTALALLAEILPTAILALSFPKSMYWTQKSDPRFVRPIRWVLAILGEGELAKTVEFEILGVKSGNFTFGHRVHGKSSLAVKSFSDYGAKLRRNYVEFDRENRRQSVQNDTQVLLEDFLVLVEDQDLEEWLVNSTEWPSAIRGGFDKRFLHLPREILITVMRDHQKYFAVENREGKLDPYFISVLNVDSDELGLIRRGHERVLQARFRDAEFFWDADQRVPLRERAPRLKKVTYQAELGSQGSYADKVRRMLNLAERLSDQIQTQGALKPEQRGSLVRAVELSKCDLTTQMVQEFAELEGVVGGLYAKAQGEPEEVATAIYDHYQPKSLEDSCPRSLAGAAVSLVDKLDSVVAGFAAGLKPSGSSDPFGLRRNGNGIIKVLLEVMPPILFSDLVVSASESFSQSKPEFAEVYAFFIERLVYFLGRKFRYDTIRAVVADRDHEREAFSVPREALRRVEVLERFRDTEDFVALAQAAKRVRNILAKSAKEEDLRSGSVEESILEAGPEADLFRKYCEAGETLQEGGRFWSEGRYDYEKVFSYIASFRPLVDRFFDKVLVMAEDALVRQNRLLLLGLLDQQVFSKFVRLSEIVPGTPDVNASTSGGN